MDINNIISLPVISAKFPEIEITLGQQAHWICKSNILLCLHWTEHTVTILQLINTTSVQKKKHMKEFWSLILLITVQDHPVGVSLNIYEIW